MPVVSRNTAAAHEGAPVNLTRRFVKKVLLPQTESDAHDW